MGISLSQSTNLSVIGLLTRNSVSASTSFSAGAQVCGNVSAYLPATAFSSGLIKIGGLTYSISPGVSLNGVVVGADLCFAFCFDETGKIVSQSGAAAAGQNFPQICGVVTNFSGALGGSKGSVTIGGAKIGIYPGIYLGGQDQVSAGSNSCLIPVEFANLAGPGSFFTANTSTKQIRVPAIVHGRTFGPNSMEDTFWLPEPMVLSLDSNNASVFSLNQLSFGKWVNSQSSQPQGFSYSIPNSTVQAISCTDSLWDLEMEIASSGITEGDMVTVNLLNADKSLGQQVAMFTVENGGAVLKQLHPDVRMTYNGMSTKGVGYFAPFFLYAGTSGLRTAALAFAFSQSSQSLNGCFQLAVGIKRANGAGTLSVALNTVVLKRMETFNDRDVSINIGRDTNLLGWFPTGKVCDVVCTPCNVVPSSPPGNGWIAGYVYCDSNDNGIKETGEAGLSGVTLKLLNSSGAVVETKQTNSDGYYSFDVPPGNYKVMEVQPGGVTDGKDTAGDCGGAVTDDMIAGIPVTSDVTCAYYNFGELCTNKCDTICWRTTQFFITNSRYLPGGAILIPGVNANNPTGIQQNLNAIRIALQGGSSPMQKLSKEFVTAQLSMAYSGGTGSPVVFNAFWSPLSCSGVSFAPVTINGVTLDSSSLLDTLVTQTTLAIKQNRQSDMQALANIWMLINGKCN